METQSYTNNMIKGEVFGSFLLTSRWLETETSYVDRQLCLHHGVPLKILDIKAWVEFPGWQYSMLLLAINTRRITLL